MSAGLVDYLRRSAVAVYVAMDKAAADDLAPRLREAADCLERFEADRTRKVGAASPRTTAEMARRLLSAESLRRAIRDEIATRLWEMDADLARLRGQQAFTHAPECLSRIPDFDARDCNCREVAP